MFDVNLMNSAEFFLSFFTCIFFFLLSFGLLGMVIGCVAFNLWITSDLIWMDKVRYLNSYRTDQRI